MKVSARGRVWLAAVALVVIAAGVAVLVRARRRFPSQPANTEWRPRAVSIPDGGCVAKAEPPPAPGAPTRFAVIGDFGYAGPDEEAVADLVKAWRPAFVATVGDNNYPLGAADTIDLNIGLFYHDYIAPYVGRFGCGAARNRFFPTLGNHDWFTRGAVPYLDYFALPGNERYYDVAWGAVHLFALDSDPNEPDGVTVDSIQGRWLHAQLAASTARWNIVAFHHAPYSSGPHGGTVSMRWPFKAWGASLVLTGHDHDYERFQIDGMTYIVNGLGGAVFYPMGTPADGSVTRFNQNAGALFIEADATSLRARFQAVDGHEIDAFTLP
ncbi:MAG TPA: metallophosphoesterase [Polyangia bacterium]|nr:metallophosphoesterase [Polyangia bacterium]